MIVIVNGPIGIGKSSLGEALSESIENCVHIDGDRIAAANPPPDDEIEFLHSTICVLVPHLQRYGYRHFVINHYWESPDAIADLERRIRKLDPAQKFRRFLLTLPMDQNLERIRRRQSARAIDELQSELRIVEEERQVLKAWPSSEPDEIVDVSAPLDVLVSGLLETLRADL